MSDFRIQVLISQSRFSEAETLIRKELGEDIENPTLFCQLAMVLTRQNKSKEAADVARQAIQLDPDSDFAHFALAHALAERKDLRGAMKSIKEAIRLDPDDANNYGMKARILAEQMHHKAALKAAREGLEIDPDNESCRFYHSILLGTQGKKTEADLESLDLLRDDPDDESNHCARGWVMIQAGDGIAAEQHFHEALRIDPESEDARDGLAEAFKIQNPLIGAMMQALLALSRMSIWVVLVGMLVITRTARMLRESDSPSLHLLAVVIDIAFYLTLVLILVAPLLSDVVLAFSPRGKFILLPRQKRAVYWALLPLAWGMLHFIYWALMGPRFGSVYALGWCGLAAFVHETNEYPQRWVRIRIFVVATVLLAIMLFVEYATYGIVRPTQLELLPYLYDQAGEVIPVDQLPQEIRSRADNFVSLRYRLILYPGLFVLLVGCFRDDVAGWFARRSPDQLDYDFD